MSHGAYHPRYTPEGDIIRKGGGHDGRARKRKNRDVEYYVRLNKAWYERLEGLLDIPVNRETGAHIAGCASRADLIEKGFGAFLRMEALAREMNYRDVDDLVTHMIEGFRFLQRQSAAPAWLSIEQPVAGLLVPPASAP